MPFKCKEVVEEKTEVRAKNRKKKGQDIKVSQRQAYFFPKSSDRGENCISTFSNQECELGSDVVKRLCEIVRRFFTLSLFN